MDSCKLDSVHCDILIPARVAARIKKRAEDEGVSMSHYINVLLFAHTHADPWTENDEKERRKLYDANRRKTRKTADDKNKKKKGPQ